MFQILTAMLKQVWTFIEQNWNQHIRMQNQIIFPIRKWDSIGLEASTKRQWSMIYNNRAIHHRIFTLILKWIGYSMIFSNKKKKSKIIPIIKILEQKILVIEYFIRFLQLLQPRHSLMIKNNKRFITSIIKIYNKKS